MVHPEYPEMGVVVPDESKITIPAGISTFLVERGTVYRRVEIGLKAAPGQAVERNVPLKRRINMAEMGWWSGDLHVHRRPSEMATLMDAAHFNLAPTPTVQRFISSEEIRW